MSLYVRENIYTYIYICTNRTDIYTYALMYLHSYIYIQNLSTYICIYMQIHISKYEYIYTRTYIHINENIYTYT